MKLSNNTGNDYLIQVIQKGAYKYDDLLYANDNLQFPMFVDEEYQIKIINVKNGEVIDTLSIVPTFEEREFELQSEEQMKENEKEEDFEQIASDIIEHCASSNFAGKTLNYLNTLKKVTGIDKTTDKSLRGAYLEFYFFRLLSVLKQQNVIDEVIWNGKIGKYGLPTQAPGGITGTPDLIFVIDDIYYVLEVTTIKPKAFQFSAEGSSVPDHVRLFQQNTGKNVKGIFCAPTIHERNTAAMQSNISAYGIKLKCITDKELVDILSKLDRLHIKEKLEEE